MRITPGRFIVLQTTYLKPLAEDKTEVKIYYRLQNPGLRWLAGRFCEFAARFFKLELKRLKRIMAT